MYYNLHVVSEEKHFLKKVYAIAMFIRSTTTSPNRLITKKNKTEICCENFRKCFALKLFARPYF